MFRYIAAALLAAVLSAPTMAAVTPFPASFHTQMVPTNGTQLYVRVGGKGRRWCCFTGSRIRETCGRRWRPCWSRTTP